MKQAPYWGLTILEGTISLNFICCFLLSAYKLEHILVYKERREAEIIMLKTLGGSVQKTKSLNKSVNKNRGHYYCGHCPLPCTELSPAPPARKSRQLTLI
jgi:hypothetical protein